MHLQGKNHIQAKILLDSVYTVTGARLTTFEIEYPRFILAEFNTHRMLSRNSASSRAIPIEKMHDLIRERPAQPIEWGINRAGMTAAAVLDLETSKYATQTWLEARDSALRYSDILKQFNIHKQVANRITEPFQLMKTVVSATEWANLWYLRDHKDAQPEFRELAGIMHELYRGSQPRPLRPQEWHLPYVPTARAANHTLVYLDEETGLEIDLQQAIRVSASCCAQVSYRRTDTSLEKANKIYYQLIESKPAHASPVEHQAMPITQWDSIETNGVTHQDKWGHLWSGNFRGWVQYRKTIPDEAKW